MSVDYATPTPQGYEYVIATGFMSSVVIVLFACLAFVVVALVYQQQHEDEPMERYHAASRVTREFVQMSVHQHHHPPRTKTDRSRKSPGLAPSFATEFHSNKTLRTATSSVSDDEIVVTPQSAKPPSSSGAMGYSDWSESGSDAESWRVSSRAPTTVQLDMGGGRRQAPYRQHRRKQQVPAYRVDEVRQPPYTVTAAPYQQTISHHPQSHSVI